MLLVVSMQTPVITRWVFPDKETNIRSASAVSAGLFNRLAPAEVFNRTTVSAVISTWSSCRSPGQASAFRLARCSATCISGSPSGGVSSISTLVISTARSNPCNNCLRRGEAEASTNFQGKMGGTRDVFLDFGISARIGKGSKVKRISPLPWLASSFVRP